MSEVRTNGRAASWIATRSGASAARASSPFRTERCRLAPARIANGARAGVIAQQCVQPVLQFRVIGRRDHHHVALLAEERSVVHTLVCFAVAGHQACTVDGKQHILLCQHHVMNNLVIGSL